MIADRLRKARIKAGYESAAAAARAFGWQASTYAAHENGTRGIKLETLEIYAKKYRVPLEWLTHGIDNQPLTTIEPTGIPEIDIRAGMGGPGLLGNGDNGDNVIGNWNLPEAYIRHEIHTAPGQITIIRVQGDSMTPTLQPEDRVMVDKGQTIPISDNIYAIWDGDGVVVKRIRRTANGEDRGWLLVSDNLQVADREMPIDAHIIGRVVWKASKL